MTASSRLIPKFPYQRLGATLRTTIIYFSFLASILWPVERLLGQRIDTLQLNDWIDQAKTAQSSFNFTNSTRLYRQAIAGYLELGDTCKTYLLANQIAYNFLDMEQEQEAISAIDSLVSLFERGDKCRDTSTYIGLLLTQHIIHRDLGQVKKSKEPIDLAYQLAIKVHDTLSLAKIYNNYTAFYGDRGANYLALENAEKSMQLKRRLLEKTDPSYLLGLQTLANYSERIGDYESAYLYLDSIIQANTNYRQLANTYHLMSLICYRRKDYAVAKKYAELSLEMFIEQNGPEGRSASYGYQELGLAQAGLQENEQALESFEKAYGIRREKYGPNHRLTLSTLSQLVKTQIRLGDTLASIDRYKNIVANFIEEYEINNAFKYALNLLEIGDLYHEAGNIDSALVYYHRVKNIADLYYPLGDRVHSEVNTALARSAPMTQRQHFVHLALFNLLGDSLIVNVNRSSFAFANDKYAVLKVLQIHFQNLYSQYEIEKDTAYLKTLLSLEPQFSIIKNEILSQFLVAKSVVESAPVIRDISLILLRASLEMYRYSYREGYLDHALNAMEESKNILLQTQLYEKNLKNLLRLPDSLVKRERELYLEINDLEYTLRKNYSDSVKDKKLHLEREYFDLRRNLLINSTRLNNLTNENPIHLEDIRNRLDYGTLIIDYFLDRNELYVLAIGQNFAHFDKYIFNSGDSLLMSRFLNSIKQLPASTNFEDFYSDAFQLYKKLFPFTINKKIRKLVILPDNELSLVPFDALIQEQPQENQLISELAFLVKKYQTIYLAGLNLNFTPPLQDDHRAIAFAPFVTTSDTNIFNVPLLQHTDDELKSLGSNFTLREFRGSAATEEIFKNLAGEYGILHIASHAIINNEFPLQSNILFYPSESGEDGRLQLWELYGMDIPAELAVLSACETADGSLLKGAGVMNISRGFSTSGTSQVISNLWPVQDFAASEIMRTFYQELKKSDDPAEALRLAKVQYLSDQNGPLLHPTYWAGWLVQSSLLPEKEGFSNPTLYLLVIIILIGLILLITVKVKGRERTS